ncbi:MAG: SPASM domain-containing protein, partial [Defluviitaleaceae bacterium]|nr:SPASM domain-containing protein [Defluviitaleaceae bacterium]
VSAKKNFRFTLTTNGSLLSDENIPYINENFDNVVLSIDGRKIINDKMRETCNGGGSYDIILPKIRALVAARKKNYYVRGTYTRHNTDFSADVLHLARAGFKNISVEPVVAPSTENYSLREEDLPKLFEEYEILSQELLKNENRDVNFFHFEMDVTGGPCIAKRVTGCGAGSEYLAVTPSGKLYPCHQFVGDEKFLIGTLDGRLENNFTRGFSSCDVFAKPECSRCWAKFYCSGGCIATAFYANGDIKKPDKLSCELMRKRIECALYIYTKRKTINETEEKYD